jgi:hypothetical protein
MSRPGRRRPRCRCRSAPAYAERGRRGTRRGLGGVEAYAPGASGQAEGCDLAGGQGGVHALVVGAVVGSSVEELARGMHQQGGLGHGLRDGGVAGAVALAQAGAARAASGAAVGLRQRVSFYSRGIFELTS